MNESNSPIQIKHNIEVRYRPQVVNDIIKANSLSPNLSISQIAKCRESKTSSKLNIYFSEY